MYNLSKVDDCIFDIQDAMQDVRISIKELVVTPSEENSQALVDAVKAFDAATDFLKSQLVIVAKSLAESDEEQEIPVEETENGVKIL